MIVYKKDPVLARCSEVKRGTGLNGHECCVFKKARTLCAIAVWAFSDMVGSLASTTYILEIQ